MTEDDTTDRRGRDRETMSDVSHTHPLTGETFGGVYRRGPAVTDGGGAARVGVGDGTDAGGRMKDVDHTPPESASGTDADGGNEVWRRGPRADRDADADVRAERR